MLKKKKKLNISISKGLATIPIQKLVPNIITILGLCLGITSIRYAFDYKWSIAASLIIIAGFVDGIDGRLARFLNAVSKFGAQLDSLADVVSFGVAPAIVMYLWSLHEIPYKGVGWAIVLFFVACSALRLARFNSRLDNKEEKIKADHYFTGMPITAAAFTCLLPMLISFEIVDYKFSAWHVGSYIVIIGFLMISKIPTFSFKTTVIKKDYVPFILVFIAITITGIILEPWIILPIIGLIYLITIPISAIQYKKGFHNKPLKDSLHS